MKVGDGVFMRKLHFSIPAREAAVPRITYSVLLVGDQIALVDTGVSYNLVDIEQLCSEAGVRIEDISLVINTHCHPDHIGGNAVVKQRASKAQVLASRLAKPFIEDLNSQYARRPVPGFFFLVSGSVQVNRALDDGDEIHIGFPIRVIASPGHSADSISLYLPEQSVLITGDAVPYSLDVPIYEDLEALKGSLGKLSALGAKWLVSAFAGLVSIPKEDPFASAFQYLDKVQAAVDEFGPADAQNERARAEFVLKRLGVQSPVLPFVLTSLKQHESTH
ncbi:MAG: MBL fold metallo-hydrolase [Bacillota bacterium]